MDKEVKVDKKSICMEVARTVVATALIIGGLYVMLRAMGDDSRFSYTPDLDAGSGAGYFWHQTNEEDGQNE